jgi:hypothetical protein
MTGRPALVLRSGETIMQRPVIWLAGAAVVLAGVIYLEFVIDIRTPQSALAMRSALVTHNKLPPETLDAITIKLKAKFGQDATVWQGPTGVYVRRDAEILAIEPAETFFHEALGITQVADDAGAVATFPFHVSPYQLRDSVHDRLVPALMMRVAPAFTPGNLDFEGDDFSIDHCRMASAPELGLTLAGRLLGLGSSTICTVIWKREPSRRMLFGIVVADGGNWIRPFVRGACRVLSNAWLANARRTDAEQPDYLQCLLIDRRENQPFGSGVSTFAYEIREDSSLARFYSTPRVIEEVPLGPDPRVPAYRRVEAAVPQSPPEATTPERKSNPTEPERRSDPARDTLGSAMIEAANRLADAPCDEAAKARYIESAVNYVRAWLKLMPCYEKMNCSYDDNVSNAKIEKTIGTPFRRDVHEAATRAHELVAFGENDFPKDTVQILVTLASDGWIDPKATFKKTEEGRETWRKRNLADCPAANRP